MPTPTNTTVLDRNLAALAVSSPQMAALIRQTAPRGHVEFVAAADGALAPILGSGPSARALCSRRRPLDEARTLAETVKLTEAGIAVSLGFGAGHHIRALVKRIPTHLSRCGPETAGPATVMVTHLGLVIAFEPDAALLRAVLERIDHSDWLGQSNIVLLSDAGDTGAIAAAIAGREGLVAMGVRSLETAADKARLGEESRRFESSLMTVVRAVRTAVVTTLMQSETTFRNLLMNLGPYAIGPGIEDLKGAAAGRPAIVVSAGPSLRRNIEVLARPGVRERVVIIAVQTALKPLLARGVKPHFVTALDYHEISRRFYEGLTKKDVEGVTLVADPKANPAILDAFPGIIRTPGDAMLPDGEALLDQVLGPGLARPKGSLPPGATVAHMAYYLARHLGCDPVMLVGQDLGFTDGQYYGPGAAIHQVWSGELSEFNTLEMMEWQRVARLRYRLPDGQFNARPTVDVLGRRIYTDEQMATYLVQFERDFAADAARGLTTIDATQGGVAKQHTTVMDLAAALGAYMPASMLVLPTLAGGETGGGKAESALRGERVRRRIAEVRGDVWKVGDLSRRAAALLGQMIDADQERVNRLIGQVHELRDKVERLQPAFDLVQRLNQTGTLKRARADRRLSLEEPTLAPIERQKRQIQRDITNVEWLAEAADLLGGMLDRAGAVLEGAPKETGDPAEPVEDGPGASPKRVWALVRADLVRSGLGTPRDLSEPFLNGCNPLRMTLLRLSRCAAIDGIAVLCEDPGAAERLAGSLPASVGRSAARFVKAELGARTGAIRGARLWSGACWRGGLSGLTVYDEALEARAMSRVMEEVGADAAVVVNGDWALLDPALVDAAAERYRQRPDGPGAHRLTFCQAAPGLGCCVIDRSLMRDIAEREHAGALASVGGLIGYMPLAPAADPIAKRNCVTCAPAVRDAAFRFIPDSGPRRAALMRALAGLGARAVEASAAEIASAMAGAMEHTAPEAPQDLVLELCTGRLACGVRSARGLGDVAERRVMTAALADRLLQEMAATRADAGLTLWGAGDPLLHPDVFKIIGLARRAGIAGVHLRTDLLCGRETIQALLESGVDAVSVDLMAESAATYRAVMGADLFDRVRANLIFMLEQRESRSGSCGIRTPWIVPRITKCDASYEDVEPFFDRWLLGAGAAVIDPLPALRPGERIEPLPIPAGAARRMARQRMTVLSDGRVPATWSDFSGDRAVGDAKREGLIAVWRRVCARRDEYLEPKPFEAFLHGGGSRARVASLDVH